MLAAAAGLAGLSGCGGRSGTALTTSDFTDESALAAQEPATPAARAPMGAAGPQAGSADRHGDARVVTIVPIDLQDEGRLATSTPAPGASAAIAAATPEAGGGTLPQHSASMQAGDGGLAHAAADSAPAVPIDALVGHINGHPVYASEMLADMRRLMEAAALKGGGRRAWEAEVEKPIQQKLRARVENELMLAESRESLTPAQRKGLQFVLDEIRGTVVREEGGGSALRAEQRLLASEERTLDEEVAERLDQELIKQELRTKIFPLVQVSYRDVKLRYRRDFEKYNPPKSATFRVLRVAGESSDAFKDAQARLAAGEAFEAVAAADFNRYPDDGLVMRSFRGELAEEELFFGVVAPLNEVARTLAPGQTAGPIELGNGDVAWVRLETLETPEPISLYEAQLAIENELRNERLQRELTRYVDRLRGAGSFTSEELMTDYLTMIGANQHLASPREEPQK